MIYNIRFSVFTRYGNTILGATKSPSQYSVNERLKIYSCKVGKTPSWVSLPRPLERTETTDRMLSKILDHLLSSVAKEGAIKHLVLKSILPIEVELQ